MQIGIFGTGIVGQALAGALASKGHEVMIGTRDPAATLAHGTEMLPPLWPRPWGALGTPMFDFRIVR